MVRIPQMMLDASRIVQISTYIGGLSPNTYKHLVFSEHILGAVSDNW